MRRPRLLASLLAGTALACAPAWALAQTAKPVVMESGEFHQLPSTYGVQLNPGTTSQASENIPCSAGAAPSSPNDGDLWCTSSGLYVRVGSTTVGPLGAAGGGGTVTSAGLSLPGQFSCSGSPITSSGTFTCSWSNQSANQVFAGPSSGSAAAPTFRALVGADLPNPSASTLGGVESITSASHQWVAYIDTSGVPHQSQPAFSDLSGSASSSQISTNLSAAIDAAVGSTRGAILERGASAWTLVSPSSSVGYVFTSNGVGADPTYQAAGGSGGTSNPFPIGAADVCTVGAAPPLSPCPNSLPEGSVIMRTDVGYTYSQFLPATSVPARVQEQAAVGTFSATLSAAPTPGDYMVAMGWSNSALPSVTSGWTSYQTHNQVSSDPYAIVAYRLVHHGDTAAQTPFTGSATCADGVLIIEVSGVDMVNFTNSVEYEAFGATTVSGPSSITASHTTTVANEEGVVLTGATRTSCNLGGVNPTLNSGWSNVVAANGGNLAGEADVVGSEAFPASSSSVTATTSYFTAGTQGYTSFLLMLQPSTDPLDTGPQQVSYLDAVESGGVAITSGPGPRSLNFASGLSATVDSDNNVTVTPTNGVNCSGTPTSSFASVNGIVTHC